MTSRTRLSVAERYTSVSDYLEAYGGCSDLDRVTVYPADEGPTLMELAASAFTAFIAVSTEVFQK